MIPYDDLVAALAAWRERQGLPVSTLGGAPVAAPAPPPAPARAAAAARPPSPPPPPEAPDTLDVDESLIAEDQYDNEGADFALSFSQESEATAIGSEPKPHDTYGGRTDPNVETGRGKKRNEDW
jgi:hypothetical protein